jgi:general secretion pathway protein G
MMELLVVIGILALLATLAISNVTGIFGGAQDSTAKLFVNESMTNSLFQYRLHMGDYPSTAEGLAALVTAPANKASSWRGPYVKENTKMPILDPWGEPYQYRYPGTKNPKGYDLWSKGPDKTDGTADDIGNWDKDAATAAK